MRCGLTPPRVLCDEAVSAVQNNFLCAIEEEYDGAAKNLLLLLLLLWFCGQKNADDLEYEADAAEVIAGAGGSERRVDMGVDEQRRHVGINGEMRRTQTRDDAREVVIGVAQIEVEQIDRKRAGLRAEDVKIEQKGVLLRGWRPDTRLQVVVDVLHGGLEGGGGDEAFSTAEMTHVPHGVCQVERGRGRRSVRARVQRRRLRQLVHQAGEERCKKQ